MAPDPSDQRLNELEQKWLNGSISQEEGEEYARWYNANQEDIIQAPEKFASSRQEHRDRILSKINLIKAQSGLIKPIYKPKWLGVAAAAAVIFILGTAGYLFFNNEPKKEISEKNSSGKTVKDVPPGGNRALLTLGDGTSILLDSANNGMIAQQGNTKVVKLANGLLSYDVAGKGINVAVDNSVSTPRGGQYKIILPDGTAVWLNAESSITYPTLFTGRERNVSIKGEAYFEVAKNARKPFKVTANNMVVEVLGTHFDVNAYKDERSTKTTLLEGSVRVSMQDKIVKILSPGEQSDLDANGKLIVIPDADVESSVAWKNGLFQFSKADIQSVMRQLARWYDVEIEYRGKPTTDLFGGDIRRDLPLSNVLGLLEKSQIHFTVEGKKIVVMP